MEEKKARIKTACVSCRKRKSKCDGLTPCTNCINYKKDCTYPQLKPRRKRGKGKTNNKHEIGLINERLQALENVIIKLSSHLDKDNTAETKSLLTNHRHLSKSLTNDSKTDESYKSDDETEDSDSSVDTLSPEADNRQSVSSIDLSQPTIAEKSRIDEMQQTFGCHSIYSIFSISSIGWLRKKVKNDLLLEPLKKIPLVMESILRRSTDTWLHPPTKETVLKFGNKGYFPLKSSLVFEILDAYYDQVFILELVVDLKVIRTLFENYYSGAQTYFRYSELILMNSVLALCLAKNGDRDKKLKCGFTYLKNMTKQELFDLQENFFNNSISYYEMVSVMSEGLTTLQCLTLMAIYVESLYPTDQIVNMLTSLLIRYAQDLGIHRILDSNDFSAADKEKGKNIWLCCEYFDITTSYRSSRSPMINCNDTTTFMELWGSQFEYLPTFVPTLPIYLGDITAYGSKEKFFQSKDLFNYSIYQSLLLKKIQRRTYEILFSARAQSTRKEPKEYYAKIDEITAGLDEYARKLHPCLRPTLLHKKDAKDSVDFAQVEFPSLFVQLDYLAHYLIVERSSAFQDFPLDETMRKNLSKAVDCARTILVMVSSIDVSKTSKMTIGWTSFFVTVGFLTLLAHCVCIPNPSEDILEDVSLLVDTVKNYFASNDLVEEWEPTSIFEQKIVAFDLITRMMLKVVIDVIGTELNQDLTKKFKLEKLFSEMEANLSRDILDPKKLERIDKAIRDVYCNSKHLEPTLANIINTDDDEPHHTDVSYHDNLLVMVNANFFNLPNFFHDF